jgi:hypothetical protein
MRRLDDPPSVQAAPEDGAATVPAEPGESEPVVLTEVERALGQTVRAALDLSNWQEGTGLERLLTRMHDAIARSVLREEGLRGRVRAEVLRRLAEFPDAPEGAGVYRVDEKLTRLARRNLLLAGQVTAADGACVGHDGLAATLVAVGISLARYDGLLNSWRTTFLRHDYDLRAGDLLQEVRSVLDRRARRDGVGNPAERDQLSYLLRRGLLAAAERKALLERASTRWRMGRGMPAPLELLTGSGSMALLDEALPVLEALLLGQTRWVYLPAGLGSRALSTLAHTLQPGELALLQKGKPALEAMVDRGTYDAARKRRVQAFAARAGDVLVVGGFRASPHAPAQLFVAHAERALEAGVLALADAALQPHQGSPLLLELAALGARTGLGVEAFRTLVESAYARSRAAGLFRPERIVTLPT